MIILKKNVFIFYLSKGNLLDYSKEKIYCKKKLLKNMSVVFYFWFVYLSWGFIFIVIN